MARTLQQKYETHGAAAMSFSIQDGQLKARLGEPTAAFKPSGITTETKLYIAGHKWE